MATAVLAEDERAQREALRAHLAQLWPELEVLAEASDGIEALRMVELHAPDVVFLDIEMPGLSGLEVARQVEGRAHIVFITAFEAHAIPAFERGALDYLLKPYELARLATTLARVKARIGTAPLPVQAALRDIAASMPAHKPFLRWINAPERDSVRLIPVDEVLYFQSDHGYTRVVTADGESLILRSLKELADELDPAEFWMIHRSTIVNAKAVERVSRDLRGRVHAHLKSRPEKLAVSESHEHLFRRM